MIVLMLAYTLAFGSMSPHPMAPFDSMEACQIQALKMNRTTAELTTPEARAVGAEFVCFVAVPNKGI